jgi:protein-tyrosine-phosphatase
MAEYILRTKIKMRKIKWWDVSSCGINAEVGGTMSDFSMQALSEMGIEIEGFKPKQLTQKIIDSSEVVITMTAMQKQLLEGCGNIMCISDICGYEIADPYGKDYTTYRATCLQIEKACDKIIDDLILQSK